MATNISKVYLLNVPLEDDMKNTLYFVSSNAQQTYFQSVVGKEYTKVSYQKETNTFRCPDLADNIKQYNYIMYQNTGVSSKWYYGFIKSVEVVSIDKTGTSGVSDVIFEIDPLQTYMFDITVRPSFVEREHTNNDTVGANTYPEGLETGEYIVQEPNQPRGTGTLPTQQINYLYNADLKVVIGTSATGMDSASPAPDYNGVFGGVTYVAFPHFLDARGFIMNLQRKYSEDPIVSIFMCPLPLIYGDAESFTWHTYSEGGHDLFEYGYVQPAVRPIGLATANITKPTSVDGYIPRNNKVLAYPYQFLDISNNAGTSHVYQYELFKGSGSYGSTTCNFKVEGVICPGCAIQLVPRNYNKTSDNAWNYEFDNFEEAIDAPKLPTCSWNNDVYINWLTQNGVNITLGFIDSAVKIAGGIGATALGGVAGFALAGSAGISSGFSGIINNVTEMYSHSKVPNTAKGGTNQGDLIFSDKRSFNIYKKCIKQEYAKIIDDFFDMYGYKTCRVKTPNSNHRENWWYTKTVNANITGNVPNDAMNKIKQAYNDGLTFWKNPANFLNYSVSNGII